MNEADAVRKSILSTKLPTTITRRLKGKSRVAVKTIEDLEQHIRIIDHLTYMYQNYHGHKKLIGELLGVTSSRISEWKRIWNHANQMKNKYPDIRALMDRPKTPLKFLLDCLELKKVQEKDTSKEIPGSPEDSMSMVIVSSSSSNHCNSNSESHTLSQLPHDINSQVYIGC